MLQINEIAFYRESPAFYFAPFAVPWVSENLELAHLWPVLFPIHFWWLGRIFLGGGYFRRIGFSGAARVISAESLSARQRLALSWL